VRPSAAGSTPPAAVRWRVLVTGLVLAAVWWPARPGATDGFPFSTYPMFAEPRAARSQVHTVLGVRSDGRRVPLRPAVVGGSVDAKHALHTVMSAVVEGRAVGLCEAVRGRVEGSASDEGVVAIEVVTDTWDPRRGLEPEVGPLERVVHARCEVGP